MANIPGPIDRCLTCNGEVWDNRGNKQNPKSPDFKCKDKACGVAYWIGDGKPRRAAAPRQAPPAQYTPPASQPPASHAPPAGPYSLLDLEHLYKRCVWSAMHSGLPAGADVTAAAATLFIQATRYNLKAPQTYDQVPAALQAGPGMLGSEDDLPF